MLWFNVRNIQHVVVLRYFQEGFSPLSCCTVTKTPLFCKVSGRERLRAEKCRRWYCPRNAQFSRKICNILAEWRTSLVFSSRGLIWCHCSESGNECHSREGGNPDFQGIRQNWTAACAGMTRYTIRLKYYENFYFAIQRSTDPLSWTDKYVGRLAPPYSIFHTRLYSMPSIFYNRYIP